MSYRAPIEHAYICHNCRDIIWGPLNSTCEECGLQMISVEKMHERDTTRARACLAKHGVDKATATQEQIEQPFTGTNLTLFLTNGGRA